MGILGQPRAAGSLMLYVCPTPIGNLKDVTVRVLEVLREVDLIACEDTRHTRVLLDRYGIAGPDSARLISFHDHNEEQRLQALLPLLRQGKNIAVVSDAGMPGLSDPGFSLVRACAAEDIPVTVLPGPSSIATALVVSGLPVDRFAFVGFLARSKSKLIDQLATFEGTGATVVGFESPRRLRVTLGMIGTRWPERRLAVCRELTKLHEEVVRGTAAEVLARLAEPVRGEIVLVLESSGAARGPNPIRGEKVPLMGAHASIASAEQRAREVLAELQRSDVGTKKAASLVALLLGMPTRRAYELALEAKEEEGRD